MRPAATTTTTTAYGTRAATPRFHASTTITATAGCSSGRALPGGAALGSWPSRSLGTLGFGALSAEQSSFVGREPFPLRH